MPGGSKSGGEPHSQFAIHRVVNSQSRPNWSIDAVIQVLYSSPMATKTDTSAPLSLEYRNRILSAIAECDRYIAKEGSRATDLRPTVIQKQLDFYISHRAKLQRSLDTNSLQELKIG